MIYFVLVFLVLFVVLTLSAILLFFCGLTGFPVGDLFTISSKKALRKRGVSPIISSKPRWFG